MTLIQQIIVLSILYLCAYALIDRICKCIEHCATAKAYSNQHTVVNNSMEVGHETNNEKQGMA